MACAAPLPEGNLPRRMMKGIGRGLKRESRRYVYCVRSEAVGVSDASWGV